MNSSSSKSLMLVVVSGKMLSIPQSLLQKIPYIENGGNFYVNVAPDLMHCVICFHNEKKLPLCYFPPSNSNNNKAFHLLKAKKGKIINYMRRCSGELPTTKSSDRSNVTEKEKEDAAIKVLLMKRLYDVALEWKLSELQQYLLQKQKKSSPPKVVEHGESKLVTKQQSSSTLDSVGSMIHNSSQNGSESSKSSSRRSSFRDNSSSKFSFKRSSTRSSTKLLEKVVKQNNVILC